MEWLGALSRTRTINRTDTCARNFVPQAWEFSQKLISSLIYPLVVTVVGAPHTISHRFLHFFLFSTALWDLPNSRPAHSLILSSHLFPGLPCLLPPFTVPCKMVLESVFTACITNYTQTETVLPRTYVFTQYYVEGAGIAC